MKPFAKGTRVVKINSLADQLDGDGSLGRVAQVIGPATGESSAPGSYGYMVMFDSRPLVPVFVPETRLWLDGVDVSGAAAR